MRRPLVFFALAACSNAPATGDAGVATDAALPDVLELPLDATAEVAAFDAGCAPLDAALGGIGIPANAKATATSTYLSSGASSAIDGDLGTVWNAGGFAGSITISFESPETFDGVKLWVSALPTSTETYTVYGIQDTVTSQIAQSIQSASESGGALETIAIPNAAYDGVRIDVDGNQSWVAINEIALATASCP